MSERAGQRGRGLDLSRLSPADAVVALRSFPRRYRSLLTTFDDDERPDDLVHRRAPDGLCALDHAEAVAGALADLAGALRSVLVHERPVLAPSILTAAGGARSPGERRRPGAVEAVLDQIAGVAGALADQADAAAGEAWVRTGSVDDGAGREVGALELLHQAVRVGAAGLHAVEQALAAARHA